MKKCTLILFLINSLAANTSYHTLPTSYSDKISIQEINHVHSTHWNGSSSYHTIESNQYLSPLDALDLGIRTGNKAIIRLALQKLEYKNERIDLIPALITIGSQIKEFKSQKNVAYIVCGILGGLSGAFIWLCSKSSFSPAYVTHRTRGLFGIDYYTTRWQSSLENQAETIASGIITLSFFSIAAIMNYFSFKNISKRYTDIIQFMIDSPTCYISNSRKARCELKYISTFLTQADKERIDTFLETI